MDSSVWVDFFSSTPGRGGGELRRMIEESEPFALTGVVVAEILQGLTRDSGPIERFLGECDMLEPRGFETYLEAAAIFRAARARNFADHGCWWKRRRPQFVTIPSFARSTGIAVIRSRKQWRKWQRRASWPYDCTGCCVRRSRIRRSFASRAARGCPWSAQARPFRRTVIHSEIPGSWSFNLSGKLTGASHRTGKLCP